MAGGWVGIWAPEHVPAEVQNVRPGQDDGWDIRSLAIWIEINTASVISAQETKSSGLKWLLPVLTMALTLTAGAIDSGMPVGGSHARTFSMPSFLFQSECGWWCSTYTILGWVPRHTNTHVCVHTHTYTIHTTPESQKAVWVRLIEKLWETDVAASGRALRKSNQQEGAITKNPGPLGRLGIECKPGRVNYPVQGAWGMRGRAAGDINSSLNWLK